MSPLTNLVVNAMEEKVHCNLEVTLWIWLPVEEVSARTECENAYGALRTYAEYIP